jgi:hypothetical protein
LPAPFATAELRNCGTAEFETSWGDFNFAISHFRNFALPEPTIVNVLSLSLFVFGVVADHPHHAFAVDDLALVANLFY